MRNNDIFEWLEQADDELLAELSHTCAPLDIDADRRIFASIQEKCRVSFVANEDGYEDVVEGVDVIVNKPWKKVLTVAATLVVLVGGLAGGAALLNVTKINKQPTASLDSSESAEVTTENTVVQEHDTSAKCNVFQGCLCGNGMLYGSSPVRYIDFDTMESAVLCAKPNCTHTTSECVGMFVGENPIMYNDFIYFFKTSQKIEELGAGKRELKITSKLCRVSVETSELEELVTFNGCKPRDYDGWLIVDDTVWFTADDMNPREDGYGNIATSNQGGTHFICSIDLKTRKFTNYGSVYDGDKEYEAASNSNCAQIKGMYNGKILIWYSFAKNDNSRAQDQDVYDFYSDHFMFLMFEFDPVSHTLAQTELPVPSYVDEDTYIYTERDKTVIIRGGETAELPVQTDMLETYYVNGKLFDSYNDRWYDLNDNSEHSFEEYHSFDVVAFRDGCYILRNDNTFVKLMEEELRAQ